MVRPTSRLTRSRGANRVVPVQTGTLVPDEANPRKPDATRLALLKLSITKLGFIQPVFARPETGLLLSGHQRTFVAGELGIETMPVMYLTLRDEDVRGSNVLFNRATNDFAAFDTGSKAQGRLDLDTVLSMADALEDYQGENWLAYNCRDRDIKPYLSSVSTQYDKKAVNLAQTFHRMGVRIPAVVSESGKVVNGVYRILAAAEDNTYRWPTIVVPDAMAEVALAFLNYLSMDYHVDGEFQRLLRHSAYRRPQNNRGVVPKAMRFFANGHRTLPDAESYSSEFWARFRDIHGATVLDFGSGLSKAAPALREKGVNAFDFEPFLIKPDAERQVPDPDYSRQKAREFLQALANPRLRFDSIFLCSVLNSVPFLQDRMCVLAIVHALCTRSTVVYGTCRDISDFNYEYGGIRNANYFTFDSEPGVRIGDVMRQPKIQKFETQDSARQMFSRLWKTIEFWPGGNVFYFRLSSPIGINPKVLAKALEFEFDLPYADGTSMGLAEEAKQAFSRRLMTSIA
jgi:hypothetical protein